MNNIRIRPASPDDIPFVAQCVLAAVDLYDFKTPSVEKDIAEKVCSMSDTLYSYRNARIAEVEGIVAGCLVSYDGGIYKESRAITFRLFEDAGREIPDTEMETGSGEYYLDSLAVVPALRGYGIGRILVKNAADEAIADGFRRVSLIVEKSKPALRSYYEALGFEKEREMNAFGDVYDKLVLNAI